MEVVSNGSPFVWDGQNYYPNPNPSGYVRSLCSVSMVSYTLDALPLIRETVYDINLNLQWWKVRGVVAVCVLHFAIHFHNFT